MYKKILIAAIICLAVGFILGNITGYKIRGSKYEKRSAEYFAVGKAFYDKGMYAEASEMFNRSLGLEPEKESTRLLLSSSYRFMNLTSLAGRAAAPR